MSDHTRSLALSRAHKDGGDMSGSHLAVIDRGAPPAAVSNAELLEQRERYLDLLANVLEEGKDYGRVPGTPKPTLYKPGAEMLMVCRNFAADDPLIEDLSTSEAIRYRLRVPIRDAAGRLRAAGVGECSSDEEKYRWRRPVCDEEYSDTPEHLRREKWSKGSGEKPYKQKQIRTSPADLANTILKMAHKRAFIHGTLLATAASSVFNQDLNDFNREVREAVLEAEPEQKAPPKKEVKRQEGAGRKASAPSDLQVSAPACVLDVKPASDSRGEVWLLALAGDPLVYRTRNATQAVELEKFKGTAHPIRVSFKSAEWQGAMYHNIENFAIADAKAPGAAPPLEPPPPEQPPADLLSH